MLPLVSLYAAVTAFYIFGDLIQNAYLDTPSDTVEICAGQHGMEMESWYVIWLTACMVSTSRVAGRLDNIGPAGVHETWPREAGRLSKYILVAIGIVWSLASSYVCSWIAVSLGGMQITDFSTVVYSVLGEQENLGIALAAGPGKVFVVVGYSAGLAVAYVACTVLLRGETDRMDEEAKVFHLAESMQTLRIALLLVAGDHGCGHHPVLRASRAHAGGGFMMTAYGRCRMPWSCFGRRTIR